MPLYYVGGVGGILSIHLFMHQRSRTMPPDLAGNDLGLIVTSLYDACSLYYRVSGGDDSAEARDFYVGSCLQRVKVRGYDPGALLPAVEHFVDCYLFIREKRRTARGLRSLFSGLVYLSDRLRLGSRVRKEIEDVCCSGVTC